MCLGAAAELWFTALFLEGDASVFAFEWLGLAGLLAGLSGAVLLGYSHGQVARSTMIAVVVSLAAWAAVAAAGR